MGRLVAFDQQTASTLVARTRTSAQLGHGSPLKAALANEHGATLLMPGNRRDEVLVVSVRRPAHERAVARAQAIEVPPVQRPPQKVAARPVASPAPQAAALVTQQPTQQASPLSVTQKPASAKKPHNDEPVAYEATGFLGLYDSPLYEEDIVEQEKQAKKKWWQKLLD